MLLSVHAALPLALILSSGPTTTDSVPSCTAPGPHTELFYPSHGWGSSDPDQLPSASYLGAKLAGTYDLFIVTLSGAPFRALHHWQMTLSLPTERTRASWDSTHTRRGGNGSLLVLFGQMEWLSARRLDTEDKVDLDGPPVRALEFIRGESGQTLALLTTDISDFFAVRAVGEDGVLVGEWTTGGHELYGIESPSVLLSEHPTGYFCAFPVRHESAAG